MTQTTTNGREHMDVITPLLRTGPRHPSRHYKLSPGDGSLAFDLVGQPCINRKNMSARAVISTDTVDRVGDLLIPAGCRIENFRKNPVVLWAHGLEGIGRPIGTSRDPDGNLAVSISKHAVEATSWFSQSSLEAAQIFELIDEGIVRATSVRETPIKSYVRHDPEEGDVLVVEEWDLEEWSWCAVGINPDAVAKTLHRNRLGGQPISKAILKSLNAVSPTLRRLGVGFLTENTVAERKSIENDDDALNSDDLPVEANSDPQPADNCDQPYGSTVVSAVHASLLAACQNLEDAMGPLENPTVKEGLSAILAALQQQIAALEGLHATSYPDQSALKDDSDGDGEDGSAMKAFLASGSVASLQVLGLGARLKGLIAARNLTPGQRRTLAGVSYQMSKLVAQSKAHQAAGDDAKIVTLQKSIQELSELVGTMKKA